MPSPLTSTDVLKSLLISTLNHAFSIGAAWCVQHAIFSTDIASAANIEILAAGAAAGLISLGMLLYRKAKNHNLVVAAIKAPANTPIEIVKADAAELPLIGK